MMSSFKRTRGWSPLAVTILTAFLVLSGTQFMVSKAAQPPICKHLTTQRPQCFDDTHVSNRNSVPAFLSNLLGLRNTINLEVVWWETQAMQTFALEILLREKLGYEVELHEYTAWLGCIDSYATYAEDNGIENGPYPTAQLQYLNLMLGKKSFDVELWTQSGKAGRDYVTDKVTLANPAKVAFDGILGPSARNGWFINAAALKGKYFDTLSLIQANGGFDTTSPVHLVRPSELPVLDAPASWKDDHCSGEDRKPNFQGGVLDCVYWTWESPTANCCTRRMKAEDDCGGLDECFALIVENPGWLPPTEKNEIRVIASAAPLEIVYAGPAKTKTVVKVAEDLDKPTIFYWWEPDLFIQPYVNDAGVVSDYRFARVNMLDEMFCANNQFVEAGYRSSYSMAFAANHTSAPCDFAKDILEKASYLPDRLYFQDAFYLFSKYSVTFEESWNLVNQTQNTSLIAKRDEIWTNWEGAGEDERINYNTSLLYSLGACEWLKQNPHLWQDYIEPNEYIFDDIKIIFICLVVFIGYVLIQMVWIYRPGAYYNVEVKRSLEVLEAHDVEPFTAGKPKLLDGVDLTKKPAAVSKSSARVNFIVKEISCRSDEKCVEFSIESNTRLDNVYMTCKSGPHRSEVPDSWGTVPHAVLNKDFGFPYAAEGQNTSVTRVDDYTFSFSVSSGITKLRVPILRKSKQFSPLKGFHFILQPGEVFGDAGAAKAESISTKKLTSMNSFGGSKRSGLQDSSSLKYGDASIFASSIPVLSIKIFPSEPFMHGSSSTGLDVKGKSAFWTYNSLFVLIKNCLSVPYIAGMQWKYQLKQASVAMLETFLWGRLFQRLLDEGLILKKADYCIEIGLAFAFIEVYKFHVGLHYFNGAYMIKSHFEQLLLLKYNILSTADLTHINDSEPYFRVTIFTDCEAIREEFWKPLNEIFEQLYRMVGASAFLAFTFRENMGMLFMKLIYGIPYGFLGFSLIFLFFRCSRGLKIGLDEDRLEVIVYSGAHVILHNTLLVRELRSVIDFCSLQYDRLWFQLNGGIFERWYHLYYNTWMMQGCLVCVTAVFYALPTKFLKDYDGDEGKVTVGEYLVSLTAMIQLLTGCVQIFVCSSSVLEVLSKVEHIAELLNFQSSEEKRICNIPMNKDGMRDHEGSCITLSDGLPLLVFEDVSVAYASRSIFENCSLVDRSSRKVSDVRTGGIIGVLRNSDGSSRTLMNLLMREEISTTGKVGISPTLFACRVNSEHGAFVQSASLRSNFILNAESRVRDLAEYSEENSLFLNQIRSYDSRKIWDICKFVGLSSVVIGSVHESNWSEVTLDSLLALLDHNDLIKIRLVRALLALPEVLVLDEVGDDMSVQDLQEMHKVLVAYLEYKIPGVDDTETCKLLRKVANVPRTIIWSGFKRTLQPYVDAKNFMLVVKDSSKIIFTAPDGAW
jgi:hypothetical protein